MPRLRLSGRVRNRVGVAVLALGLPLTAFMATAPAQTSAAFSAVAAADGMRVSASAPGFLVVEDFIDAGGPTAQAAISDLEGSRGFASVPYPGDLVLSGPGLLSIAAGIQLPAGYPFYAASAYPTTPEAVVDQPGLHMESHSEDSSSAAAARLGPEEGGNVRSSAKVLREANGITAEALGVADLVKVGPVEVKGFVASAKVTRTPGGEPQRSSSMQFGAMTVADTPVGVRDGVLVVAGSTVPLEGFAPVQEALKEAGVTVELVKATDTEDGVLAPGLLITRSQPMEAAGTTFFVRYTLGRALAAARVEASAPSLGVDLGGVEPEIGAPAGETSPLPSAATEPATAAGPLSVPLSEPAPALAASPGLGFSTAGPDLSSGSGYGLPGDTATTGAAPAVPLPSESAVAAPFSATAVATEPIAPLSSWSFFPMMLLAGVVVAVAALGRRLIPS